MNEGMMLVATVDTISPLAVRVKPGSTVEPATPLLYAPAAAGEGVYVLRRADTGAALIMAKVP